MAVLHEYVPSSSKSGYYLRDSIDGNIITYQIASTAESLILSLGYDDGDRLAGELIQLLHRLRLIYTHKSGVEPPKSLQDISGFENDETAELSSEDREQLLQFLLDHADLSKEERNEILEYAYSKDVSVDEQKTKDSQKEDKSTSGQKFETDLEERLEERAIDKPESKSNLHEENPEISKIRCGYCDREFNVLEYTEHIYRSGGNHGEVESFPPQFILQQASDTEEAGAEIVSPDHFEDDIEFYPICRWCGKRFFRIGTHRVHIKSNRSEYHKSLHSRNPARYNRPLIIPFTPNQQVPIPKFRLAKLVTDEALSNLYPTSDLENSAVSDRADAGEETFEARLIEYERDWLLSELARFLTLLTRHYEEERIRRAVSIHHDAIIEKARTAYNESKDLPGSLRDYKAQWKHPEIGVRVPRQLLSEIGAGDYRGEMFLPPGYCYPVAEITQALEEAWLEQTYSDESWNTDSSAQRIIKPEPNGGADDANDSVPNIPLSAVKQVISQYEEYEGGNRQASWFHAAEILRRKMNELIEPDLMSENETRD